jgi:positive regulator of sigma E activity
MEQIAVIKSVQDNGMAEIAVERETACGAAHSCHECNGCEKMMTRTHNVVLAYNDAQARKGDVVKVRSENASFFKTAAIVYLLPLILALVFYGGGAALGIVSEGLLVLCAFLGLAVGILIAVAWDRHMKKSNGLRFHVVEIIRACSGM